jgi:hypothetical protein
MEVVMGYYSVDYEYLSKYLSEVIPSESKFKPLENDIINIVFMDVDVTSEIIPKYKNGFWLNESDDPSQLYFKDTKYHIRVKDLALDFFSRIISGELLDAIIAVSQENDQSNIFGAAVWGIETIVYIKHIIKDYIVKLNDNEYCIYLKLVAHFMEHKVFSVLDVIEMFNNDKCDMHNRWHCDYYNSETCEITDEQISNSIQAMAERNILKSLSDNMYKIRY